MTILDALEELTTLAEAAQSTGAVPPGAWTMALSVLIIGSHAVADSGALTPTVPVEINEIGEEFEVAMAHMREVLARRTPLGGLPPV